VTRQWSEMAPQQVRHLECVHCLLILPRLQIQIFSESGNTGKLEFEFESVSADVGEESVGHAGGDDVVVVVFVGVDNTAGDSRVDETIAVVTGADMGLKGSSESDAWL